MTCETVSATLLFKFVESQKCIDALDYDNCGIVTKEK